MRRVDYAPFVGDGRMRIEPSPVDVFGALPNTQPMSLTLAQARSAIARIMLHGGRSTHSGQGGTLWVILTYLQHHAIPYELKAMPGHWYEVKLIEDPTKEPAPTAFPTKMPHDSRYIKTVEDFDRILANSAWAWPGGYPLYFICYDGEALSFQAAQENVRLVREAVKDEDRSSGWYVVAYDINWEDMDLRCSHTNELIECAYPGDDPPPEYAEMIAKKYPSEVKK